MYKNTTNLPIIYIGTKAVEQILLDEVWLLVADWYMDIKSKLDNGWRSKRRKTDAE